MAEDGPATVWRCRVEKNGPTTELLRYGPVSYGLDDCGSLSGKGEKSVELFALGLLYRDC